MPWTVQNPPPPAKNWSDAEKRRCVLAGNAALREGKSEREAVFACIGAARKQTGDRYEIFSLDAERAFQYLTGLYLANQLTLSDYQYQMERTLQDHYIRLAILGLGRQPTSEELIWLQFRIEREKSDYLIRFIEDVRTRSSSDARLMWRAGQYGWARDIYIYYTMPEVSALMPVLPGEDCLGRDRCRCWLEKKEYKNRIEVFWHVDPMALNCEVCLMHQGESPFIFMRTR